MDNSAILTANGNGFNNIEALRNSNENARQEPVNTGDRDGSTGATGAETDVLELSRESVDFALEAGNTILPAEIEVEPEPRNVETTLLETAESNQTTIIGPATATNLEDNLTNETTANVAVTAPAAAAENEPEVAVEALETEAAEAALNAPVNTAAQTVENVANVERPVTTETVPAGEPETVPEEPPVRTLEEQANELSQINNILNTTNGLTVGPAEIEPNSAEDTSRNQQQILLQNVGSQLAQVIPPASVISVLG
ncbi:MAG: hypothetical protein GY950_07350 [bacterium]|nr:hypothetical protein [bacterium]